MFFFFFNDTATTEIYTLSPTRRSSDLTLRGNRDALERLRLIPQTLIDTSARHQRIAIFGRPANRSEEHTSELQSRLHLVCRLLLEKKKKSYRASVVYYSSRYVPEIMDR